MKQHPFHVHIEDHSLAHAIENAVRVGHYFVFVEDDRALGTGDRGRTGLMTRLLGRRSTKRRSTRQVLPLASDPVELSGVTITPDSRRIRPMACVVTERDLYRVDRDTVHLFAAAPGAITDTELVIQCNGEQFARREVDLSGGMTVEPLAGLLAGSYTAQLHSGDLPVGRPASFTVADYTLAPLTGRLVSHQLDRDENQLAFELVVDSYQVPFADPLVVTLVEAGREIGSVTLAATSPGAYSGELALPDGKGPFRLRLVAEHDAARVAEVVIPGSRARERDLTTLSELGTEALFSLMPEPGAIPVRGGYLGKGDTLATPLTVPEVVTGAPVIQVRAEVASLVLIALDLDSGELRVIEHGQASAGSEIAVATDSPATMVIAGCFAGDRPFEGYTTFLRPSELALEVSAPGAARPGDDLVVELRSDSTTPVPVLLCVRDQRLTATDTPALSLGASLKAEVDRATAGMSDEGLSALREVLPSVLPSAPPPGFITLGMPAREVYEPGTAIPRVATFSEPIPSARPAPAPGGAPSMQAFLSENTAASFTADMEFGGDTLEEPELPDLFEPVDTLRDITVRDAEPPEFDEHGPRKKAPPSPRAEFPAVLFYDIVAVSEREEVRVPLGDSLGTFAVEAFALAGGDWIERRARVVVDKPVRIDLELPPAVHPEDVVIGRLRAATASGQGTVSLTRDDEAVALRTEAGEAVTAEAAVTTPVELEFDVAPGRYVAVVCDPADPDARDTVTLEVARPGAFRVRVQELGLLRKGDRITLESAGALSLRVMPAIDQPLDMLLTETAGYTHLCCEQAAAKILAATFMYLTAEQPGPRKTAEEIILAGVAREKRMITPDRGFTMYPDEDYISEYLSKLAVRYLWSLRQLGELGDIPPSLRRAARQGVEMADQAARAHGMDPVPRSIDSMEDAYAAATAGGDRDAAQAYVDRVVDFSGPRLRAGRTAVGTRAALAYAGAILTACGDFERAITAANFVTRQFNEGGRLYSTVDSVAAIALMVELRAAGLISGQGKVVIDGQAMTTAEAATRSEPIDSIEVESGVAAVRVVRVVEEDWTRFSAEVAVRVGFRAAGGEKVSRFATGDRTELVVALPDGYQAGDLVHVALPACMSWIHGGGKVKRFTVDFAGADEVRIPLVVTEKIAGSQRFAVCVRNMFEEERTGNPGLITVESR